MTAQTAMRDRAQGDLSIRAADRLIVALDVPDIDEANRLVDALGPTVSFFKLGHWLQLVRGFEGLIDGLIDRGKRVFLDTKGSDIPETMRAGATAAASRGISFLTIHGNGEVTEDAMRAVVEGKGSSDLKILSVTVLTSLDDLDLRKAGYGRSAQELAHERASRALRCGCDGVITSGQEAHNIRELAGDRPFLIVTPGIRPAGAPKDDQKRSMTPTNAIRAGADYLVVGRPIVRVADPLKAAEMIAQEMQAAFDGM